MPGIGDFGGTIVGDTNGEVWVRDHDAYRRTAPPMAFEEQLGGGHLWMIAVRHALLNKHHAPMLLCGCSPWHGHPLVTVVQRMALSINHLDAGAAPTPSIDWFHHGSQDNTIQVCLVHGTCPEAPRIAWKRGDAVPFFGANTTKAEWGELVRAILAASRGGGGSHAENQVAGGNDEAEALCNVFAEFGTTPKRWLSEHQDADEEERRIVAELDCPELEAMAA